MNLRNYITVSPDIQFGKPVFKGTVPVQTLFFHPKQGVCLNEFPEDFPGVSIEQAGTVLELVFLLNNVSKGH